MSHRLDDARHADDDAVLRLNRAAVPHVNDIRRETLAAMHRDASIVFHERMGFRVVGEQETEGGRKRVALMTRG